MDGAAEARGGGFLSNFLSEANEGFGGIDLHCLSVVGVELMELYFRKVPSWPLTTPTSAGLLHGARLALACYLCGGSLPSPRTASSHTVGVCGAKWV